MKIRITLAILLVCGLLNADPVIFRFQLWGEAKVTESQRLAIYVGWVNGFLSAMAFSAESEPPDVRKVRQLRGDKLCDCLEAQLTHKQAVAIVDKFYKDHPEKWSAPLGAEILEALMEKGPCDWNLLEPVTR
jgi:hypothetical protein